MKHYTIPGFTTLATDIADWVFRALGADIASSTRERAKRVLEEAIELCQAEGVEPKEARDLVTYVYARPVGRPSQEAAGVGFCWIAYCEARGFSGPGLVIAELERIDTPAMIENVRRKHDLKAQAGVSLRRIEQ